MKANLKFVHVAALLLVLIILQHLKVDSKQSLTDLHLQVVNRMLTQLAKKKLDAVIAEAADAQFKLESDPSTTVELANFLSFLDEIHERVRLTFHL